jgi:DNA-binding SARP family transcriptional activator/predicted ATPase
MTTLRFCLFGTPRFERGGQEISVRRRKGVALLAYVAVTGHPHSRDALATLLWPTHDQAGARTNLRRELSRLKTTISGELLIIEREQVAITLEKTLWLDVTYFLDQLSIAHAHDHANSRLCPDCVSALSNAVSAYRDDFMAGFSLPDCPEFDEWQFFQAENLRHALAGALQKLIQWHVSMGEYRQGIELGRRWLAQDPLHERARRQLMRLYAWSGQPSAAVRQYREFVRLLDRELGVAPEEETVALHEAIRTKRFNSPPKADRTRQVETVADSFLVSSPSDSPPTTVVLNLPPQTTSFVGRRKDLAEISRLLRSEPDCHLLTLVGPGGIGKTRLAVEASNANAKFFAQGAAFVPLASVNPAMFEGMVNPLVASIADALDVTFHGGRARDAQLLEYLREKEMLLVLDNLDQLVNMASFLSKILLVAPSIRILVTSRERLNLQQEWLYPVQGLNLPPIESDVDAERREDQVETFSAVQLFIQRARLVRPEFDVRAELTCVVQVCHLVKGMPLGIELAAAWIRMMPCQVIAEEIEKNAGFLFTQLRDMPERHRSLRAVFEYSWRLLTVGEKEALRNISVFRGGFQRQAAEIVAGASLSVLTALLDKSLLQVTPSGRYYVHDLLRQFAAEKLRELPRENDEIQVQHSRAYLALLQEQESQLKGPRLKVALDRIAADIDNVRAAWNLALAQGRYAEIRQSLDALWLFYETRGWYMEADDAFGRTIVQSKPRSDEGVLAHGVDVTEERKILLGRAMAAQGWFKTRLGRFGQARTLFSDGLSVLRQMGDDAYHETAYALLYYGISTYIGAEPATGINLLRESLTRFRQINDTWAIGHNLVVLGQATWELGRLSESEALSIEGISVLQQVGDVRMAAYAKSTLGRIAQIRGDYPQATRFHLECLQVRTNIGDRTGMAFTLNDLGEAARLTGEHRQAELYYQRSADLAREIGLRLASAQSFLGRGKLALERGDHAEAKQLFQNAVTFSQGASAFSGAEALVGLGWAALGLAEIPQANLHFDEALKEAVESQQPSILIEAISGLAHYLAGIGKLKQSLELVVLARQQPAGSREVMEKMEWLMDDLTAALPNDVAAQIQEHAKLLTLDSVVTRLTKGLT